MEGQVAYRGIRTPDGCLVVKESGAGVTPLPIRHDLRLHSAGFEWSVRHVN